MSVVGSQRQTFLRLVQALQPHWRRDVRLPERIQRLLAGEKRFGSRDRRLYRELLYTTLRHLPWVEASFASDPERAAAMVAWLAADLPATHTYRRELTAGWPDCPERLVDRAATLQRDPRELLPAWIGDECPAALQPDELDALHRRSSLWLRLQTETPDTVFDEFRRHGWTWRRTTLQADAVEILGEADATRSDAHRHGAFEVQDLGSQLLLAMAGIAPGGHWLDACAGAGGKTLQLARLLGPAGRVTAHDIRPTALRELRLRSQRAGLRNVATTLDAPTGAYDGVLVDAPCSGSGTWRRAPHLKWVTVPATVAAHASRQSDLLERFSRLVHPGGRLIYATCSLHHRENEAVISAFLARQTGFEIAPLVRDFGYPSGPFGTALLPARHNTDGFFLATLQRR